MLTTKSSLCQEQQSQQTCALHGAIHFRSCRGGIRRGTCAPCLRTERRFGGPHFILNVTAQQLWFSWHLLLWKNMAGHQDPWALHPVTDELSQPEQYTAQRPSLHSLSFEDEDGLAVSSPSDPCGKKRNGGWGCHMLLFCFDSSSWPRDEAGMQDIVRKLICKRVEVISLLSYLGAVILSPRGSTE